MNIDLQIQTKKLELIQWLSTIEDLKLLERIAEFISQEQNYDWGDEISELERKSIETGIAQAKLGKLNPHAKARELYFK